LLLARNNKEELKAYWEKLDQEQKQKQRDINSGFTMTKSKSRKHTQIGNSTFTESRHETNNSPFSYETNQEQPECVSENTYDLDEYKNNISSRSSLVHYDLRGSGNPQMGDSDYYNQRK